MLGSMFDAQACKEHREEMVREVARHRLSQALRDSRKRRGAGRAPSPAWKLKRTAGLLLELLRAPRTVGLERRELRLRETAWLADTELVPDGGPEVDTGAAYPRETEAPESTAPTDERR